MVASPLNVQGSEIQSRKRYLAIFEEMVGDLVSDEIVQGFHGGGDHSSNQLIHHLHFVTVTNDIKKYFQIPMKANIRELFFLS